MKFTFSVRRKGIKDFDIVGRLKDLFPTKENKIPLDPWTIVTASNARLFCGLQLLCYSLSQLHTFNMYCYDLGLTTDQLKWCEQVPGLQVKKHVQEKWLDIGYWQAWIKPFYIDACPYQKCFWIDADTAIFSDLTEIIKCAGHQALFTPDYTPSYPLTLNLNRLYERLPIEGIEKDDPPYLNTGVFLLDKKRDAEIIKQWCYCVQKALDDSDIADQIACWDQGACRWALQHEGLLKKLVVPVKEFNFPDENRQFAYPPRPSAVDYFLRSAESSKSQGAVILHWCGSPKPWERWSDMLDVTI